jgi:hypothetical protein
LGRFQTRAVSIRVLWALPLAVCVFPSPAAAQGNGSTAAQGSGPVADSAWAALRAEAQVSLFRRLHVPPDPDPDVLRWYPLLRYGGPERSGAFVPGVMASALSRAACGPNRVCRFYLESAYQREYGLIPERASWLGGLLGRALLPEIERRGLSLGSAWWPEVLMRTDP